MSEKVSPEFLWKEHRKQNLDAPEKTILFSLILLVALSSAPIFSFYLNGGGDLQFHLCRIEAIRQALLTGQFPVRISGYWNNGYGYASSVLYGEVFLYFPALLRIIGFSPQSAYKMYLLTANIFTCLSSYYCLKKICGERLSALMGTALYMLVPYRLSTLHLRAAVGEYTAMIFLPLVIYGLYLIYTQPGQERKENGVVHSGWFWLALGFTGLIQCHVISTFMAGLFTALVCVIKIRKTIRKDVWMQFVKAAVCTLLVNLWFVLPFLDYMRFDYNVSGLSVHSRGRFASHAAFLSQMISFFPQGEGASIVTGKIWDTDYGTEMSYTLGGGMMLALVLYMVYCFYYKEKDRKPAFREMANLQMGLCILSLLMATSWFPWDFLQQRSDLIAWITGSIQFPWRFMTISSVTGAFVSALLIYELRRCGKKDFFYGAIVSVGILTALSANYFLQDYEKKSEADYITCNDINSGWLGCAEYMPSGTDGTTLDGDRLQEGGGLAVQEYVRKEGVVDLTCENTGDEETYVDVPILYYKGYTARETGTGERLMVLPADNKRVRVIIPAGYQGSFEVRFESPWYWRVSELISIVAVAGLAVMICMENFRKGHKSA